MMPASSAVPLDVVDLGRMPYAEAFARQKQAQQEVIAARQAEERVDGGDRPSLAGRFRLLLVEHAPPVITVSRRKTARSHLIASPEQLAAAGVQVAETDRGGDITYHGPGQLVAYPILDLNALGLRLHGYMRFLEQAVIDTLATWSLAGRRDDHATGVWIDLPGQASDAKICAMGVRVSRWVTMHGLALNVRTNLEHFNLIVPCGLAGRPVTSMAELLGSEGCPSMDAVKEELVAQLHGAIERRVAAVRTGDIER